MMSFIGHKMVVARFVAGILLSSKFRSASITITTLGSSEDCCVRIATDTSSEDTEKREVLNYFVQQQNISIEFIRDGLYRLK